MGLVRLVTGRVPRGVLKTYLFIGFFGIFFENLGDWRLKRKKFERRRRRKHGPGQNLTDIQRDCDAFRNNTL